MAILRTSTLPVHDGWRDEHWASPGPDASVARTVVRYAPVYRDNQIVSETWQIDPKLAVGTVAAAPVAGAAKTATY